MPGYVTHYIFGRDMYEKLNDPVLKNNLYKNRAVYALGHQGPDIFFYYLPAYVLHGHNLGDMAHTENTGAFYAALLESRSIFKKPEDLQIANAYLEGFLGHYIETEIDTSLLELKYHRRRADFHIENTIMLTPRQKWIVARMLHYAYQHTYHGLFVSRYTIFMAIFATQLGFRILYDSTGQKKVLFRFAEKHTLGYPVFSPLIANDSLLFRTDPFNMQHKKWTNPWDSSISSVESFFDLYGRSEEKYLHCLAELSALLKERIHSPKASLLTEEFLKDYGNASFHSGLDCTI